jgi:hypothetical protein
MSKKQWEKAGGHLPDACFEVNGYKIILCDTADGVNKRNYKAANPDHILKSSGHKNLVFMHVPQQKKIFRGSAKNAGDTVAALNKIKPIGIFYGHDHEQAGNADGFDGCYFSGCVVKRDWGIRGYLDVSISGNKVNSKFISIE